nr:MAG TPA: RHINO, Protein deadlock pathway, Chromoshadow, Complex, PROTEIN.1A [Caudoviricetes sp.]DAQ10975.1 MAG TPA: RHINO, Protein deadlock pathway, Chromoshadow, Complex, PROTEIN.1A [Caudoviricetes sp.]
MVTQANRIRHIGLLLSWQRPFCIIKTKWRITL